MVKKPSTNNSDPLIDYLQYYKSLKAPGFAVLVTGEWGSGKTFQVKNALAADEYYYVSLFGLKSDADVYGAVFAQMHPAKAGLKELAKRADNKSIGAFGFSAPIGSIFSAIVDAAVKDTVNTTRLLVFDDLERCEVSTKATLGILNRYVEHLKCKVVVIAHDAKLAKDFSETKEKIFGQTVKVIPKIQEAFNAFLNEIDEPDRSSIRKHMGDFLSIFKESEVGSLRILRQVINNVVRLNHQLTEKHKEDARAMKALVRLSVALDLELKAGRLEPSDIRDRKKTLLYHTYFKGKQTDEDQTAEQPRIAVAASRYKSVELDDELLSDDVLTKMLVDGLYETESIRSCVDRSVFFSKPAQSPPWRTFINFDRLPDDVVQAAANSMQGQLNNREVTEIGELLHLFSLRLMMVENKLIDDTFEDVVALCKTYVDDLVEAGRYPADIDMERYSHGHEGMGYWVTPKYQTEFATIYKYIGLAIKRAWKKRFPTLKNDLLKLVAEDGEGFVEKICFTASGKNEYARIPILASIDVEEFVDVWTNSDPKNWTYITNALKERSLQVRPGSDLEDEQQWMRDLVKSLESRAKSKSGVAALRIRRAIPNLQLLPEKE